MTFLVGKQKLPHDQLYTQFYTSAFAILPAVAQKPLLKLYSQACNLETQGQSAHRAEANATRKKLYQFGGIRSIL
eukprot:1159043-Pelagomonas_calceolata.AAC.10